MLMNGSHFILYAVTCKALLTEPLFQLVNFLQQRYAESPKDGGGTTKGECISIIIHQARVQSCCYALSRELMRQCDWSDFFLF